jgi:ABC-2 type transport system ATP-binding protein
MQNKSWIIQGKTTEDIRPEIFRFAADHNFTLLSLQEQEKSLEQIFQELTKN